MAILRSRDIEFAYVTSIETVFLVCGNVKIIDQWESYT